MRAVAETLRLQDGHGGRPGSGRRRDTGSRIIRHNSRAWPFGLAGLIVVAAGLAIVWAVRPPPRHAVLTPDGQAQLAVMDFAAPFTVDPLPAGWYHRKFWTRAPAHYSVAVKDGVPALRAATDAGASMLVRFVDVELARYPLLRWRWFIETPIVSDLDERTRAGDDHPARLFLRFVSASGEPHAMEIIWGNRELSAGDEKYLGTFPHYVANGGGENVGSWHDEEVDLEALYAHFWPSAAPGRLVEIGVFSDSDETGTQSLAYYADLSLARRR